MALLLFLSVVLAALTAFGFVVARTLTRWASPQIPPVPTPTRTGNKKAYTAENPEVVIIGAGVVGATMAIQFGKQGRQVVVVERQMEAPDRIVGEFLQPGGYNMMKKLGVDGTITAFLLLEAWNSGDSLLGNSSHLFSRF